MKHRVVFTPNQVVYGNIEIISYLMILLGAPGLSWMTFLIIFISIPSAVINFIYRRKNYQYMRFRSKERREMDYYSGLLVNKDMIKEVRMGLDDKISNAAEDAKGKAKETAGKGTDNERLEAEGKGDQASKAMFLLKVCVAVIVAIGAIFSILSMFILTLSIYLLLQKNTTKLENLVLIGYTPRRVALPYNLLTLILNLSILVISIIIIVVGQGFYMGYISQLAGCELSSSPMVAIVVGVIFTTAIILFNFYIINRKIKEISRKR